MSSNATPKDNGSDSKNLRIPAFVLAGIGLSAVLKVVATPMPLPDTNAEGRGAVRESISEAFEYAGFPMPEPVLASDSRHKKVLEIQACETYECIDAHLIDRDKSILAYGSGEVLMAVGCIGLLAAVPGLLFLTAGRQRKPDHAGGAPERQAGEEIQTHKPAAASPSTPV